MLPLPMRLIRATLAAEQEAERAYDMAQFWTANDSGIAVAARHVAERADRRLRLLERACRRHGVRL